jgi:hypothetical protein
MSYVRSCGGAAPRCRITRLCIVLRAASRAYPASFAAFLHAPHHPRDTQSLLWPSVVGLLVLIYSASSAGTIDPNRNNMTSPYTLFLSIWSMMFLQVSLCDTLVLGCHIMQFPVGDDENGRNLMDFDTEGAISAMDNMEL